MELSEEDVNAKLLEAISRTVAALTASIRIGDAPEEERGVQLLALATTLHVGERILTSVLRNAGMGGSLNLSLAFLAENQPMLREITDSFSKMFGLHLVLVRNEAESRVMIKALEDANGKDQKLPTA